MTHASLVHLTLPQWIEEGLAQMFEHDMAPRPQPLLDARAARQHKHVWGRRGLNEFWFGDGFYSAGRVQELSYKLEEVLVRLLIEDFRPRWFGWDRAPQRRLVAFLRAADATDGGEAAAREHLGMGLGELASRFLGPGDWEPREAKTPADQPVDSSGTPSLRRHLS
jgi:hypothetical protein